MELTQDLKTAWSRNGIASRFFVDPDTCEEIVRGLPDLIFILTRVGETTWKLTGVKPSQPVKTEETKQKPTSKRSQRYEQYQ